MQQQTLSLSSHQKCVNNGENGASSTLKMEKYGVLLGFEIQTGNTTSRIIIKGLENAIISVKSPHVPQRSHLVKHARASLDPHIHMHLSWAQSFFLFLNSGHLKQTLDSFGLLSPRRSPLSGQPMGDAVILDDEFGSRMANLESLGGPVDGHLLLNDELDKLLPLLSSPRLTLLEMTVWVFLSSCSLLYYSSTTPLLDIFLLIISDKLQGSQNARGSKLPTGNEYIHYSWVGLSEVVLSIPFYYLFINHDGYSQMGTFSIPKIYQNTSFSISHTGMHCPFPFLPSQPCFALYRGHIKEKKIMLRRWTIDSTKYGKVQGCDEKLMLRDTD